MLFVASAETAVGSGRSEGADTPEYLISFNQQWVGDHTEEWFHGRGPRAREVVDEIKAAGAFVFAEGLRGKAARQA